MPAKKPNGVRKKPNGVHAVLVTPASYVDDDGFLCITGARLWRWRALDAELRAAMAEMDSATQQIQVEVAKNPVLHNLLAKKQSLIGDISLAKAEVLSLQTEIEKDLSISLKDCAFDDKTGRLYNLAADGSRGEPVKRPKSRNRKTASV